MLKVVTKWIPIVGVTVYRLIPDDVRGAMTGHRGSSSLRCVAAIHSGMNGWKAIRFFGGVDNWGTKPD
jgi:hypothetical protein